MILLICGGRVTNEWHEMLFSVQGRLLGGGGTCPEPHGEGVGKVYAKIWRGERPFR